MRASFAIVSLCCFAFFSPAKADDSRLLPVYHADQVWNGITISDDGRSFVCFPHPDGAAAASIAEIKPDNSMTPYPDNKWNVWKQGDDATKAFVRTNSLRIGPDHNLWIVDTGSPSMGGEVVPGGAKLVAIDLKTNRVVRKIDLTSMVKKKSFVDDVRFNGSNAYLTDAGEPALIVLDMATGKGRRVLENDPPTTDERSMHADGRVLVRANGEELRVHADQLEVTADGSLLYFQPCSGPLYKIETRWLDDASVPPGELLQKVKPFFDTPTIGGCAIDADGNIYISETDRQRISKITPAGDETTVVEDKRLLWGDAMWIDNDGFLWIPSQAFELMAPVNGGFSHLQFPVFIYKIEINAKPVRR